LLLDDRPFEVTASQASGSAPEGQPISVAERPTEPVAAGGGGLLAAVGLGSERTGVLPRASSADSSSSPAGGLFDGALRAPLDTTASAATVASWGLSLLLATVGGLLLNLMPCVFPVIGLKVLGFAQGSPDSPAGRQSMRRGGFAFAMGVLVSFWLLGALMLVLRAAGDSVGWGFQLQSPVFVAAMALLFVLIGLNFSGVYELGLSLTRLSGAGQSNARNSSLASFGAGVLAVLVASPCTAPFMGSALGLTLTQPPVQAMSVFTAIGVGMALPYVLLGCFPAWLSRLPRPGRWMQTLREALAFPMYASAAWLAWVLAQQAGVDALLRLLLAAVMVAIAAWAWGRWSGPPTPKLGRALGLVLFGLVAAMALLAPIARDSQVAPGAGNGQSTEQGVALRGAAPSAQPDWQPWSDERVAAALAQGKTVFVDFTAAWCVTCQANKQLVLERATVREAFKRAGVITLRADWTQRDPRIAAALASHGRNGVPMYLVHRPGRTEPLLLPELLTVDGVLAAIR
jgi:thiol:disulfide interchange protein DsbD